MITTYLTSLRATFNPFSASSKIPRLFLTSLSATAGKTIKITSVALPRTSIAPSTLELEFKDGKNVKYSWGGTEVVAKGSEGMKDGKKARGGEKVTLADIIEEVDRHAKALGRKEELAA
jgi:large subunit ribosomal protein L53